MGFLKLIVKQNAGKEYLRNAVNYITENADACCYSGINICPERAYKQMRKVKKYYGKTSGNQLVHFVVCFNNEVNDIAMAEKYTRKIAEYYKSRYQILYAIHDELRLTKSGYARSWFHVHIVMNSVSFVDGKMFADNKKDIGRFMEHISEVTGDDWWRLGYETEE